MLQFVEALQDLNVFQFIDVLQYLALFPPLLLGYSSGVLSSEFKVNECFDAMDYLDVNSPSF